MNTDLESPVNESGYIEELAVKIRQSGYDEENVKRLLLEERNSTVNALLMETTSGRITLDTEQGKSLWRTVLSHYSELNLEKGLIDVESRLYDACAPLVHKALLAIRADARGMLFAGCTFGVGLAGPVVKKTRNKEIKRYLEGRLGEG